jgi:hypothetical protein
LLKLKRANGKLSEEELRNTAAAMECTEILSFRNTISNIYGEMGNTT